MRSSSTPDERQADLQRLGVPADQALAWLAEMDGGAPAVEDGTPGDAEPGAPLAVWPENWPALQAWLRLQTQWHLTPTGRLSGLRYPAVDLVLRRLLRGQPQDELDRVFDHLVEMEHAAVEALDE